MKTFSRNFPKTISNTFYTWGVVSLVVSLVLSMAYQRADANELTNQGNCDTGWVAKVESAPFVYNGDQTITRVIIKSSTNCFLFTEDGNDLCYAVTGIGTTNVTATRIGVPGPSCQEISHVEFYSDPLPPPTNTPVTPDPTNTPVTPDPTNTPVTPDPTNTPVTPDPTNTPVTPDPTNTPVTPDPTNTPVTPDPTDTPVAPTITATDNPDSNTPTPTSPAPQQESTPTPIATATSTPPATLPPPDQPTRTPLIIPVTGADLTQSGLFSGLLLPSLFFNFGLLLLGLGLISQAVGNYITKKEEYAGLD
jgi:hypothetical protein